MKTLTVEMEQSQVQEGTSINRKFVGVSPLASSTSFNNLSNRNTLRIFSMNFKQTITVAQFVQGYPNLSPQILENVMRNSILFLVVVFLQTISVFSQALSVDAGPDTIRICYGSIAPIGKEIRGGVTPYFIEWSPSQGLNSTAQLLVNATPISTQKYIIKVRDAANTVVYDTIVVDVSSRMYPDAGSNARVCVGTPITLGGVPVVRGGVAPFTYNWFPSIGLNNPTIANPSFMAESSQEYIVTITDAFGCVVKDSISFDVYQPLTVEAGNSKLTCPNELVQIGGNIVAQGGAGSYQYKWTSTDKNFRFILDNIPNPYVAPDVNSTFKVLVTDTQGCINSDSVYISVKPKMDSRIIKEWKGQCVGNVIKIAGSENFISGGAPPYTYRWSPSIDLSSNNVPNPTTTVKQGTSVFFLQVTDRNNCVFRDTVKVTGNTPSIPIVRDTTSICQNSPWFIGFIQDTSSRYTYTAPGQQATIEGKSSADLRVTFSNPGLGFVVVEAENTITGCRAASTFYFNVQPLPSPIIARRSDRDTVICKGTYAQLRISQKYFGMKWFVKKKGSNKIEEMYQYSQVINTAEEGEYFVEVQDDKGCKNMSPGILLRVKNPDVIKITDVETICPDGLTPITVASFKVNNDNNDSLTYVWENAGAFISNGDRISINKIGSYKVSAYDKFGCATNEVEFTVRQKVLSLSAPTIVFDSIETEFTQVKKAIIKNDGEDPLIILPFTTFSDADSSLTVVANTFSKQLPVTLQKGEQLEFDVRFAPDTIGNNFMLPIQIKAFPCNYQTTLLLQGKSYDKRVLSSAAFPDTTIATATYNFHYPLRVALINPGDSIIDASLHVYAHLDARLFDVQTTTRGTLQQNSVVDFVRYMHIELPNVTMRYNGGKTELLTELVGTILSSPYNHTTQVIIDSLHWVTDKKQPRVIPYNGRITNTETCAEHGIVLLPKDSTLIQVQPNPVVDDATLVITTNSPGTYNIVVKAVSGIEVYKNAVEIPIAGTYSIVMPLREYPNGVYPIEVKSPRKNFQFNMIIQR